jgi:hypothetical protein
MKVLEAQKSKKNLKRSALHSNNKVNIDNKSPAKPKVNPAIIKKKAMEVQQKKKEIGDKTKITHYLNKISSLQADAQKRLIEKSENNYKTQSSILLSGIKNLVELLDTAESEIDTKGKLDIRIGRLEKLLGKSLMKNGLV